MKPLEPKPPDPPPPQRKEELPEIVLDFVPSQHFRDQDSSSCLRSTFGLCYNSQNRFLTNRCRSFTVLTLAGTVVSFQPSSAQIYFIEDSPVCSLLLSRIWHSHPPCIIGIQAATLSHLSTLPMRPLDSSAVDSDSATQNMSSAFVGSLGNRKDTNYRSVVNSGIPERLAAQISFLSPFISLSLSVFSSVVTCEDARSGSCLLRAADIEPTYAPKFGWVVIVSFSGCFISLSLFRILNWLTSKSWLSEDCYGPRFLIYPAMVGYASGYLVLLGLRRSYGAVYPLSWIGYCWVLTLRVLTTMILVIPLKWSVQFTCLYCSSLPYCISMLFVGVDIMDSGCVLIASIAGLCVTGYLDRILNWYKRILLNGNGWKGQRYLIKMAMVDYPRWSWCRTLDHRSVVMLIFLKFYGLGHLLFWPGYCWVSPLRGCTNMPFVTPLKWYLQCLWQSFPGLPCSSSAFWCLWFAGCTFCYLLSIGRMVSHVLVVFWFVLSLFSMGSADLSIIWNYSCPFSKIGLHCVHNSLLWLTGLQFEYVQHTFSTVMCLDWSLHEWILSLLVYFHAIDSLFALAFCDYEFFGRILELSFVLYVENHLNCTCVVHCFFPLLGWHFVEGNTRWWLVLDGFWILCWIGQYNEQRANGIPFCMLLPVCRKDDCASICLISFLRYWSGWIGFWLRTRDGSVPGCATRPSVTPFVGAQPWTSAPRCCYPRSKWSMMSSIFSETYYRTRKGFRHCFCIWTYGPFSTKEWAFLQVQVSQITSIVVIFSFWSFVQPNVLWHFPVYFVLFIQHTASEVIRFLKPYTTSKATYQTAFGPRTFFSCLLLHYELIVHNQYHNPGRNFPRPSLLWYKNHPCWGQHGLCMSFARFVFFMVSIKTKYPVEGVPKSWCFNENYKLECSRC